MLEVRSMEATKKADKALRVFGEIKRAGVRGGEETQAFEARIMGALSALTLDEQYTIRRLYVEDMTNEEAAEADGCDTSTISRRKRRALRQIALYLYTDNYIQEEGL